MLWYITTDKHDVISVGCDINTENIHVTSLCVAWSDVITNNYDVIKNTDDLTFTNIGFHRLCHHIQWWCHHTNWSCKPFWGDIRNWWWKHKWSQQNCGRLFLVLFPYICKWKIPHLEPYNISCYAVKSKTCYAPGSTLWKIAHISQTLKLMFCYKKKLCFTESTLRNVESSFYIA